MRKQRIVVLTSQLAPFPGELDDGALPDDLRRLIDLGQAEKERLTKKVPRCSRWLWFELASVAVAVLAVVAWQGHLFYAAEERALSDLPGIQARGPAGEHPSQWVSIEVFKAAGDAYEPVTVQVDPNDVLAFAYVNRSKEKSFSHLMVLAVDEKKNIYWYYPAYQTKGSNPLSIPIRRTDGHIQLSDAVRHPLSLGKLKLLVLFSHGTLDVLSVEALILRELERLGSIEQVKTIPLDEVTTQSLLLDEVTRLGGRK
ncbi:MAG: hypothetical protein QNJ97_02165 [Myxococcota bacterium]|nr:hypothetical protein [Myxococcota bacterium]